MFVVMKKLYLLLLSLFLTLTAYTQKLTPVIKPGTVINIVVSDHGLVIPVTVDIKNTGDTLKLAWKESPSNINIKSSYEDRITRYFTQPHQEGVASERFQNDETFISVSRAMYKRFLNNDKKSLTYQGVIYLNAMERDSNFILQRESVNATYMTTRDGKYKMWVLDNPAFPLILETTNPLLGIGYKLISIN